MQQVVAGERVSFEQASKVALVNDLTAFTPGTRPHIHQIICPFDNVGVMLHYNHGIAFVTQLLQEFVQAVDIARVQSDTRLVKDIHDIHEAAVEVLDDLDSL